MVGAIIAVAISAVGLLDSLYFTLVYYGRLAPDSRLIPSFCRMEAGACRTVLETPEARVFGLPNSIFGLIYYAAMIAASSIRTATGYWPLAWGLLVLSSLAGIFSLYLAWSLIFRLKVRCRLCFLAHGINLCLAGIMFAAAV